MRMLVLACSRGDRGELWDLVLAYDGLWDQIQVRPLPSSGFYLPGLVFSILCSILEIVLGCLIESYASSRVFLKRRLFQPLSLSHQFLH